MKKYIFSIVVIMVSINTFLLQAADFSYGINSGIGFSRFASFSGDGIHAYGYPKYAYPPGFTIEVFGERKISEKISVRSGFSFLRLTSRITVASGAGESFPTKNFQATSLHWPVTLRYKSNWAFSPYFLIGADLGYLMKAEYSYSAPVGLGHGSYSITNKLPDFDVSATLGVGQVFKIFKLSYLWEIRAILGLTQYMYDEKGLAYLGSWRNNILQFRIGVYFK